MVWRHRLLALTLFLICRIALASGVEGVGVATLDPDAERIPLWPFLHAIGDEGGRLSPRQVEQRLEAKEGHIVPNANAAFGKTFPYPYWAQFAVRNPDRHARQWMLTYELPAQDSVELWVKRNDGTWDALPQLEKSRAYSLGSGELYPVWRLDLEGGQVLRFIVRIDGHNMMRFPLFMQRPDVFARQQSAIHLALGFIFAVPFVVVLYVLTLVRVADDRSLPLFLGLAVSELVAIGWISGVLHELFPWIDRWTMGWVGWLGYIGVLGISCQHARVFMNTRVNDPLAERLLQIGAWFWFLVVPLVTWAWPYLGRPIVFLVGSLHVFILAWLALRGYLIQRSHYMALFLAAWLAYAVATGLYMLYRVANLPIYVTLSFSVFQAALVAALLGCAVSVQIVRRRSEMIRQIEIEHDRGLLFASAHHDLWQPLQSMGLYSRAFRDADESQRLKLLRGMDAAMTSINDFMAGWRQLSGKTPPQPTIRQIDIDEVLAPIIEEYRYWCQGKHIMLRYRPLHLRIQTDVQYLQRIVRNLLSNAMRYTEAGGRILVGGRRHSGRRWLVVADTGIGMNPEQASQCFEAFKRFGDMGRVPEGMGIGLYSVKQMAQTLGLQTSLRSKEGRGTVVAVALNSPSL